MQKVIFNSKDIVKLDRQYLQLLKEKITKKSLKTVRLCLHKNINDLLHEMIIIHSKDAYVRPHKHKRKTETFHLIEGSFFLVVFDRNGKIVRKIFMSDQDKRGGLLCRFNKNIWHTVIPLSDFVVFHEITNGPYVKEGDSTFASWAPEEKNKGKVKKFIQNMLNK